MDIIESINGTDVFSTVDIMNLMATSEVGANMSVVLRDMHSNKRRYVNVILGSDENNNNVK